MMWPDWINPLVGWLGLGGVSIAGLLAVAFFFPPFRKMALAAAGVMFAALAIYRKGYRDNAELESQRREEAVRKAREAYDKIDDRPDDAKSVDKRLRDGSF